ncbi:hypothetical protein CERSUDRAFT_119620 [Gelatoporia subvermispora B]|uniref:Uncharacterized protein n=1 Tax=Ceriporiopsis subvermispora (strain B) TaxID=914234 RepID=M2P884_CERS8|nr:hypothetical protein CERSUDRAFT_119620 [Gelatoporia subvermispora B]
MSAILEALRLKPKRADLKVVYKSWHKAPTFQGKPKKDGPVDVWLGKIKAGCRERGVPREQWHLVARHYMRGKAEKRFEEVDRVMQVMHSGKYVWSWKKYKVAVRNMGWGLSTKEANTFRVERRAGLWTVVESLFQSQHPPAPPLPPIRRPSFDFLSRIRSRPDEVTIAAKAPTWLVNATRSLGEFVDEHQALLMVVGAILVVTGHVPAVAAVLGVGGAVLTGPAAQLVGTILVEMGQSLYDNSRERSRGTGATVRMHSFR